MCRVVDLERLCELCADPNEPVVSRVKVGQKFAVARAMAAEARYGRGTVAAAQKKAAGPGSAAGQAQAIVGHLSRVCPGPFVVENKFDGWRVCLHVPDIRDLSTARCAMHCHCGARPHASQPSGSPQPVR